MDRDDIQLLYEYDRWANGRVLTAASALAAEQFTRDLGGSFRSVRDTLVHIIGGEWMWLEYWKQKVHTPEVIANLKTRHGTLFNPAGFPDAGAVKAKWTEVEAVQVEFVSAVTNESLNQLIPARGGEATLAHLMQHLANHSTYHRGQVSLMLRQLGAEPLPTDFHAFLIEGYREAAAGR